MRSSRQPSRGEPGCALCTLVGDEPAGGWVYRDEDWAVGIMPGFEIPGALVGLARRHVEGLGALGEPAQASLGPLLVQLSTAISTVTDAEAVYTVAFGENYRHWHFMLLARSSSVPPEHRSAQFILAKDRYRDMPAAIKTADAIRALLNVVP
jgi:hypothetical protein